jgi:predicted Zn-dependent protease
VIGKILRHVLRARPARGALAALVAVGLVGGLAGWFFWPDGHLPAAERALERRDYAAARTHLNKSLKWHPRDAHRHFLAARAARGAGRLDEAEEQLRACERLHGDGEAIDLERALIRLQGGDEEVEDYLLARAGRDDPDALLTREVLIQHYLDTYQLFKARRGLDLYLERRPDDVLALLARGFVWERLFFYADAVCDYRRAVEADPHNDGARRRLAQVLLITGPPDEAAEQFGDLRGRHPDDPEVLLGLARARRQQGRTDEACELLDRLLADHPANAGALAERGRAALEQGDTARAEGWLRRAVTLAPLDREALYSLCQCLRQGGPAGDLRDLHARLDRLDADLKRLGQLTKAVLGAPHDPALRYEAAQIFLRDGEEDEGVRWLEMALHEDPGYGPARQALAEYARRQAGASSRRRRARRSRPSARGPETAGGAESP